MKKHALIAIVISVVLTTLAFGFIRSAPWKARQAAPVEGPQSLRDRAKRLGHVTASAYPRNLDRYDDIATLTRDSTAVIVGSVESETSTLLAPAEKSIFTDSQVSVWQVLKGDVDTATTLTVRGPGGRVRFDDGTSAEVKLPDYWRSPQVRKTYVFFLKQRPAGRFSLTGGPQGLFEVTSGGSITPQVRPEDRLMQAYNGMNKAAFIADVLKTSAQKR